MTELDFAILDWMQDVFSCAALDFLMPAVTALGNGGAIWIAAGLALLVSKRRRREGVYVLLALAAGYLLCNLTLKPLIARPRPCWLRPEFPLLISVPQDPSFPSGHTVSSFAGAAALFRAERKFGWAAFPLAAAITVSRLYLYVHFPSDVAVGVAAGLLFGIAVPYFAERLRSRRRKPRGV